MNIFSKTNETRWTYKGCIQATENKVIMTEWIKGASARNLLLMFHHSSRMLERFRASNKIVRQSNCTGNNQDVFIQFSQGPQFFFFTIFILRLLQCKPYIVTAEVQWLHAALLNWSSIKYTGDSCFELPLIWFQNFRIIMNFSWWNVGI